MSTLIKPSASLETIRRLIERVWKSELSLLAHLGAQDERHFFLPHAKGSGRWLCASALIEYAFPSECFHLFITDDIEQAAYIENDISNLLPKGQTFLFPPSYKHADSDIYEPYKTLRTEALYDLRASKGEKRIWVAPIGALMEEAAAIAEETAMSVIRLQEKIDIPSLMENLQRQHFEATEFAISPGQIARRGGIIDIFPYHSTFPYRIELHDNVVSSLRAFDPENQLAYKKLSRISLLPSEPAEKEKTLPLWRHLPPQTCFWIDKWNYCKDKFILDSPLGEEEATHKVNAWEDAIDERRSVEFSASPRAKGAVSIPIEQSEQPVFNKKFDLLIEDIQSLQKKEYTIYLSYAHEQQYERLFQIFEDLDASIEIHPIPFSLKQGFIDHSGAFAVYTDHEIFNRYHRYHLKRAPKSKKALGIKDIKLMQPGDYITHIDHGAGIFDGLQKIDVNGKMQEAIRIRFKDNDILYVNIHSLHKIAKYIGKEGRAPKIHKLGSDAWAKTKEQAKKKVKAVAFDLIKLYANRKKAMGFAHSADNYLQNELEASFLYEETKDQLKAIEDVKRDMQSEHPMDRLVCGDVGFGKTEVAIRAAFKSVLDGKQVAILVPTTVLAFQHYNSFKERMDFFSPSIEFLNRFKTDKEKKLIKEKLKEGKIDIIIGTQALLAKDAQYKDLGLLIIDEEQKFGVSDKEKLKTLKINVDCLTLTATPIPRTLQFSLMGARDLSIIQTPPPNRQPTLTESIDFDIDKIKEAIQYELSRRGQVFFIHNKVEDISDIASMIKAHCPNAAVEYAHGQLSGDELEEKILAFSSQEIDVLVCTNIVESGLDIPNANTIIINNAQQFGLSDLHQLRGRVGRSNRKSYCYLITPPLAALSKEQQKRIEIIEEFSTLGSGFQISMRDLDLRGAGDILGGDQSGFIDEMGFEIYQKIINEAIRELKDEEFKNLSIGDASDSFMRRECSIETDLEIYIPDTYINSGASRMEYYKKINECENEEDMKTLYDAMGDIFGQAPTIVKDLFTVVRCRIAAAELGIDRIAHKKGLMLCYFGSASSSHYFKSEIFGSILDFIQYQTKDISLKQKGTTAYLSIERIHSIEDAYQTLLKIKNYKHDHSETQSKPT